MHASLTCIYARVCLILLSVFNQSHFMNDLLKVVIRSWKNQTQYENLFFSPEQDLQEK